MNTCIQTELSRAPPAPKSPLIILLEPHLGRTLMKITFEKLGRYGSQYDSTIMIGGDSALLSQQDYMAGDDSPLNTNKNRKDRIKVFKNKKSLPLGTEEN